MTLSELWNNIPKTEEGGRYYLDSVCNNATEFAEEFEKHYKDICPICKEVDCCHIDTYLISNHFK